MGKYCVYALNDPDGQPFYIGMGSEVRIRQHASQAKSGYLAPRSEKIRQIWSEKKDFTTEIVLKTDNQEEAAKLESQLIEAFWDTLTNQRGPNGKIRPSERDRRQTAIMYVTQNEKAVLAEMAKRQGLSTSEYLRKCCNLQIEKVNYLPKGQPSTSSTMTETS